MAFSWLMLVALVATAMGNDNMLAFDISGRTYSWDVAANQATLISTAPGNINGAARCPDGTTWAVGWIPKRLYTVTDEGVYTLQGVISGGGSGGYWGLACDASNTLYGGRNWDYLDVIDKNTLQATQININVPFPMEGLAFDGDNFLYGIGGLGGNTVVKFDLDANTATNLNVDLPTGKLFIDFHGDTMYVGRSSLYRVDLDAGTHVNLGNGGIPGLDLRGVVFPEAVAQVGGDPHFHTFDGLMHHFQGLSSVWYTAVQVEPQEGGKVMKLEMQTQSCGGSFQCLDGVRLLFGDEVVSHINTHGPVKQRVKDGHGAVIMANLTNQLYSLTFEDNNITHVKANNGVQYWVRGMWMKVSVPGQYKNKVSGLLGTYNGDHSDDLTQQHGEAIVFDKQAVEKFVDAKASMPVQQFGHTWISRNMTGGLGHKFSAQSLEGALIVNYTSGDVSNSIKDRCQNLVMSAMKQKCGDVLPWSEAEKLMLACQYDLNVCPECVDMVVDGAVLHCH